MLSALSSLLALSGVHVVGWQSLDEVHMKLVNCEVMWF